MTKYRFKTKPMKHQGKALARIVELNGVCALLMDPGTGKSKVVVDYAGALYCKYGAIDVLVAAPLSALDTWPEQIETHLGTDEEGNKIPTSIHLLNNGTILQKADYIKNLPKNEGVLRFVVINHDAYKYRHKVKGLKSVTVQQRIIKATEAFSPDLVVVDEMHRLKGHTSNVSKAFSKVGELSIRRLGLTGTVAPHSPLDFFAQWRFLNPSRFGTKWEPFRLRYAIWGGFEGREIRGFINLPELRKKVRADSFVARKRDCLDLPPVSDIKVPVSMSGPEERAYLKMGTDLLAELPSGNKSVSQNVLTKMLRLRQITGGNLGYTEIDDNGNEVTKVEAIGSSKIDVLMDKVDAIYYSGEKQVIFCHFLADIQRIAERLRKEYSVPIFVIDGSVSQDERYARRKSFQNYNGPAIFVAQMRTISLAVNELVVANYGHFFSYSQQRDDYEQARDRLFRKGQTKPVTFYHYIVPNSVDDIIYNSHRLKKSLETAVTQKARKFLQLKE